jgi:hypothetical protein
VPQIVEPYPPQPGRGGQSVERVQDGLRAERLPVLPGEHQVAVLVGLSPFGTLGCLPFLVRRQRSDDPTGQAHARGAPASLRSAEPDVAVDVGHRPAHVQHPAVDVDVGPSQRQGLTAAQATPDQHLEQRRQPMVGNVVEEGDRLGGRPRVALLPAFGR